ncbi:hypothetical protein HHI36_014719 [Cryptolaemus montrouzieri]|uniref:DUF4817 domain-containing protein n=1 Tax=Cryptolaemus montrouzieri TaxID=559131 RepID=A0ABD2N3L0_9CUCU
MNFTQEEIINMIYCLGEGERNCLLASHIYSQRYPNSRHPRKEAFERLKERFERTGQVGYEKNERAKRVLNKENSMQVALSVVENPHVSTRDVSRDLGISQTSVSRILRKEKFHPFHVQVHQQLEPLDFGRRLDFCRWSLNKIEQPNFFSGVLFSPFIRMDW